ncbi:Pyruvate dehydrogenase E1 component subunit alpha-1, mitochondrial [Vitis vinifera]|uniref:Pyruvate dehydrogenase E1 component subunit alpha-1, mitochondrial n=1 Tax=Vitis vinifera TaxID=29760 RepID=A0A438JN87_VITVI|nr:Pyruvate dehydrogenase E1 component subunit alpha-1, mitochondrial [Vitis vinifera]
MVRNLAVMNTCYLSSFFQILEMDTYRYHGHSMSDPGSTYRTRDEISGVRQERDPIERIRKLILSHELSTEAELKSIEKKIRSEVDDAIAQAKESSMPEPSELFTNVYVKGFGIEVSFLLLVECPGLPYTDCGGCRQNRVWIPMEGLKARPWKVAGADRKEVRGVLP